MGALAQRLEHGTTSEEVTLNTDEENVRSHLQRIEAACSELAAEFTLVCNDRDMLVNHKRKTTSLQEIYASTSDEFEQKMKDARRRAEVLQSVVDIASKNLEAFDQDLRSHDDNVVRLTKLRDELKNHVAYLGEEKECLKTQTPADVAVLLAYSSKLDRGED